MITYWDTSAFVPLLIAEADSVAYRELWDGSVAVVSTRLLYVEASAALHQAHRIGRLDSSQLQTILSTLDDYWPGFNVVELDEALMLHGAEAAGRFRLRGHDAVHCAAGLLIAADPHAVLVSDDARLLAAWQSAGAATAAISPGAGQR
ncbi:type II toxin-antitoxin system VapC family toxin [Arthrobacter sp.]|uniref:type II toxin-antitoxin system VapC family toxin n=1 Tax=Arthrobacter sp. TaxID=1667 RepID=UPI00258BE4A0|nr:type II toxin-antitoxin system VapC family toxin [Arthrobacter sp.]